MAIGIKGLVGRFGFLGNGGEAELRVTDYGSLAVATHEAQYEDVVRGGNHFLAGLSTLTGRAPVQAIATTTATVYLYNSSPTLSYVIDWLGFNVISGTPGAGGSLWGIMSKPTGTLPTAGSNYSIVKSSPTGGLNTTAIVAEAYTLPAIDTSGKTSWPAWIPLLASEHVASASTGQGDASAIYHEGRYVVPPGWGLGFFFLGATGTTPLYGVQVGWTEKQLDLQ